MSTFNPLSPLDHRTETPAAEPQSRWTVTRNACKLCTPLGACIAFKGIERTTPFIHGSQGCSTYIRRYMISHFKEPVDIASSNFSENTAVFGGGSNLKKGLENIRLQYQPDLIGVMTTCLSETIGDDVGAILGEYRAEKAENDLPALVHVSTPSYRGTHAEGFSDAVRAVVDQLHQTGPRSLRINLFPGLVSPADLRYLKEILADFRTDFTLLPDYSETLDGGLWSDYQSLPPGGTTLEAIRLTGQARASIEFGRVLAASESTAATVLQAKAGVPCHRLGLPVGIRETDLFFKTLADITGCPLPERHQAERRRLADAYADGHKYVAGRRAVVLGEEDLVVGLSAFLYETGIVPVLVASGGRSGLMKAKIRQVIPEQDELEITIKNDQDFMSIEELAKEAGADLIVGNSKAYKMSQHLNLPLVRVGFPVHDRFGAGRLMHLGYRGTQQLFDRIVNTLIEQRQGADDVGYTYI